MYLDEDERQYDIPKSLLEPMKALRDGRKRWESLTPEEKEEENRIVDLVNDRCIEQQMKEK